MKKSILSFTKKVLLGCLVGCSLSLSAQTFSYANGNVLIGFRATYGGTYDLVVNAGPVSTFTNLAQGGKITITALTGTLLKSAFADTNNLSWSAFACFDTSYPVSAQQNTLFMSRPRADLNTQTDPWVSYTKTSQGNVVAKLNAVGNGGVSLAAATNSGSAYVKELEAASSLPAVSYNYMLGAGLNWGGTFQGNPEQNTSPTFTTDGLPARSDFYYLPYGGSSFSHPAGTYLGYFELSTNGVLTYTAGPSSSTLVTPHIVKISRTGNTNTVYFTTGSSGTYSLQATNNLSAVRSSWPVVGSVSGNGLTNSIQEINATSPRYYGVSAQ